MSKSAQPSQKQLLSVIQTQTAIAKLGLDLNAVMTLVAEQAQSITQAKGAVVELAEDGDMVYRAVSGGASHFLGLRLKLQNSLSGLCIAPLSIEAANDNGSILVFSPSELFL